MDSDLPMVRTVIGWCAHEQSERAVPSRTLLPVSPLKEMLQQQPQSRSLPRLRIKTRPAAEVETGGTSCCHSDAGQPAARSAAALSTPLRRPSPFLTPVQGESSGRSLSMCLERCVKASLQRTVTAECSRSAHRLCWPITWLC